MAKTNKTYNRRVATSLTHLAFKRLVSDSQLHVRTRFAAALLCRLSCRNTWGGGRETKHLHELEQPATVQHNAKTPLTDIIITHPGVVLLFWLCIRQHNGERAVQLRDGNVAAHRDRQGCRQGGDRGDLPSFVSLCFLILACWLLTAKYYSGPLIE